MFFSETSRHASVFLRPTRKANDVSVREKSSVDCCWTKSPLLVREVWARKKLVCRWETNKPVERKTREKERKTKGRRATFDLSSRLLVRWDEELQGRFFLSDLDVRTNQRNDSRRSRFCELVDDSTDDQQHSATRTDLDRHVQHLYSDRRGNFTFPPRTDIQLFEFDLFSILEKFPPDFVPTLFLDNFASRHSSSVRILRFPSVRQRLPESDVNSLSTSFLLNHVHRTGLFSRSSTNRPSQSSFVLSFQASIWLTVALALEKCIIIWFPIKGRLCFTMSISRMVLIVVLIIVLLADVIYLLPTFFLDTYENVSIHTFMCVWQTGSNSSGNALDQWKKHYFTFNTIFFQSIIPSIMLLLLNWLILFSLSKQRRDLKKIGSIDSKNNLKREKQFKEKTIQLVLSSFFVIVTVSPRYILTMVYAFANTLSKGPIMPFYIFVNLNMTFRVLEMSNYSLNMIFAIIRWRVASIGRAATCFISVGFLFSAAERLVSKSAST